MEITVFTENSTDECDHLEDYYQHSHRLFLSDPLEVFISPCTPLRGFIHNVCVAHYLLKNICNEGFYCTFSILLCEKNQQDAHFFLFYFN
jgi:hypothetical protein